MVILVSNDDGVHSKGIKALVRSLKKIKARIVVVAPDREQSATSHALTLHRPLRIHKLGKDFYSVDGTPTDAVMLGVHVILKQKPDLIVSGINRGANIGEDVHYSGTVAAALEGAIMGIPAISLSVVGSPRHSYTAASGFALRLATKVLSQGLPKGVVLNVNVPSRKNIQGTAITQLGKHHYGEVIMEKKDPRGRPYFWIGGTPDKFEEGIDTDCQAYLDNKISVTPIKVDLTDYQFLKQLKKWKI